MIVKVQEGCFCYEEGRPILENINFSLESGKILTILGQNGTGKTTLLKCLMGIYRWGRGQSILDGEEAKAQKNLKEISYVPQQHKIEFPYTVFDMVCIGRAKKMGYFSMPSKKDKEISMECLHETGIEGLKDQRCTDLSGGQLQLVYLARALASEPEVLIMDEPETHLDFKNQFKMLEMIKKLVKERGISCIINTHYPEHALKISDYTLLLKKGGYIWGKTQEILTSENIEEYFEIEARIVDLQPCGINQKTFVILE